MSDRDEPPEDGITNAVLSESNYEKARALRGSPFRGSLETTMTNLAGLLGILSLVLPLYAVYPASARPYLASADPSQAAPKVLLLGVYGTVMVTVAAAVLVLAGVARLRRWPIDERGAQWLVDMETFAAYVGYGLGGASIVITVGYFVLGLVGGGAIGGYVDAMGGINPFAQAEVGLPVAHVAGTAFALAVVLLGLQWYLTVRFAAVAAE
jgi:hypothetical protein